MNQALQMSMALVLFITSTAPAATDSSDSYHPPKRKTGIEMLGEQRRSPLVGLTRFVFSTAVYSSGPKKKFNEADVSAEFERRVHSGLKENEIPLVTFEELGKMTEAEWAKPNGTEEASKIANTTGSVHASVAWDMSFDSNFKPLALIRSVSFSVNATMTNPRTGRDASITVWEEKRTDGFAIDSTILPIDDINDIIQKFVIDYVRAQADVGGGKK